MRLTLALLILAAANALAQSTATLSIDASHPTAKVSPTLYGIMSEEINHSYDGGLYAELIANRTFQNNRRRSLERWILLETAAPQPPSPSTPPPAPVPRSPTASSSPSPPPTLTPSPASSTRATGASPSIPPPPTPAPFTRAPILPASAPSPSASSTTKPAPSPPPPSSPPSAIPGVPTSSP